MLRKDEKQELAEDQTTKMAKKETKINEKQSSHQKEGKLAEPRVRTTVNTKQLYHAAKQNQLYHKTVPDDKVKPTTEDHAMISPRLDFNPLPFKLYLNKIEPKNEATPLAKGNLDISLYCSPVPYPAMAINYSVQLIHPRYHSNQKSKIQESPLDNFQTVKPSETHTSKLQINQSAPVVTPGLGGRRSLIQLEPVHPATPRDHELPSLDHQVVDIYNPVVKSPIIESNLGRRSEELAESKNLLRSSSSPVYSIKKLGVVQCIQPEQIENRYLIVGREVKYKRPKTRRIFDSSILEPSPQQGLELMNKAHTISKHQHQATMSPSRHITNQDLSHQSNSIYRPLINFERNNSACSLKVEANYQLWTRPNCERITIKREDSENLDGGYVNTVGNCGQLLNTCIYQKPASPLEPRLRSICRRYSSYDHHRFATSRSNSSDPRYHQTYLSPMLPSFSIRHDQQAPESKRCTSADNRRPHRIIQERTYYIRSSYRVKPADGGSSPAISMPQTCTRNIHPTIHLDLIRN